LVVSAAPPVTYSELSDGPEASPTARPPPYPSGHPASRLTAAGPVQEAGEWKVAMLTEGGRDGRRERGGGSY